jgi:thiamine-monophosphate kinase
VDQVVEEVTLGLYRQPETVGRIAATASLSDLAAVGADVLGLLISVTLPSKHYDTVQEALALGIREVVDRAKTHVVGGDTSEGPLLSVGCTAVGTVAANCHLSRLGAAPGDAVYASGPLGLGAALAAAQLLGLAESLMTEEEFRPRLRLAEGRALRGLASCCMDSSDGLLATLDQLARLNGVAVVIDQEPRCLLHPKAERVRAALNLAALPFLAACHGEFELIFAVHQANHACFLDTCAANNFSPVRIGMVEAGSGVRADGRTIDTTRLRNLAHEVGNQPRRYFERLLELCA